jgi:DNA-binding NtrC family response regulator
MAKAATDRPVLIIDDEPDILLSYDTALRMAGIRSIQTCQDPRRALGVLENHGGAAAVLLDLMMPTVPGEEVLGQIREAHPDSPVVVVTGKDSAQDAVACMKMGAHDYLVKPVAQERLVATVKHAMAFAELDAENRALRERVLENKGRRADCFRAIVTQDPQMEGIFSYVEAIAANSQPILITGETGTGKEVLARAIHEASGRQGAFVPVDVAGLDDSVFTDALFGHDKGAYTGADAPRRGLVEQAAGGTLFLDEIGDLSQHSQVKLLRLAQEREYRRLGSDAIRYTDARIIAATHQDVHARHAQGLFRSDLYYRLATHHVTLPPLRDRKGDIRLLLEHFLELAAQGLGRRAPAYPRELTPLLEAHPFPGNIRELHGLVVDAVSRTRGSTLPLKCFEDRILPKQRPQAAVETPGRRERIQFGEVLPTMDEAKDRLIAEALRRAQGNKSMAARMVGMTRQALNWRERRCDAGQEGA